MRSRMHRARQTLDKEANIRLRELASVLVLAAEACITEPRVSALGLPHAGTVLDSARDLCLLMKTYPVPSTVLESRTASGSRSPVCRRRHGARHVAKK
jgi:hypothetical protein